MPKFMMLSTLGPDGSARLLEDPERLREVTAEVEAMGVKVLEQFAVLGEFDFLNIIEAPDQTTMARVATQLAARGTLKTRTMPLVDIDDLIRSLAENQ
ncbi:MAG TPA: GYD domain-containing protein [Acidimicrobiales bacterium]|nr:GYD domain-containing protein [Acidimicrobiales bacterium]